MTIRWRLLLDLLGLGLLIACLAYWWLDNLAHEVIGTVFLGLMLAHNVFNRRRWPATVKPRRDAAWAINLIPILGLAVSMSIMLVTSVLISRDLFAPMAVAEGEALRTIHRFTAYWALAFAGLHLGTRWGVVMNACRSALGLKPNVWRSLLLRGVAFAIVLKGIGAFAEMGLGAKLAWRFSLDMWDFSADASGFFLNYLAITGAFAAVTHYGLMLLRASGRPSGQLARW